MLRPRSFDSIEICNYCRTVVSQIPRTGHNSKLMGPQNKTIDFAPRHNGSQVMVLASDTQIIPGPCPIVMDIWSSAHGVLAVSQQR